MKTQRQISDILSEDSRRRGAAKGHYDPTTGAGALGERKRVSTPVPDLPFAEVPLTMLADPGYGAAANDPASWQQLRCRHDFEYWCIRCVTIRDKTGGADIPFRLNAPQRRVAGVLEADRLAGRPIRMILLKARQWGGSTLVQMYMAWIQSCHRRNWHSLICAHVKDTSNVIRGMYTKLIAGYPRELWDGDAEPVFKPFERTLNVREIAGRGCRVTIASAENQEAVRGADFAMAHLSETAFWPDTAMRSPESFIRAVGGAIALVPYSLIVMESTANGVGNFFHNEWMRCREGKGDKHTVFVPWYEIEIYRLEPPDPRAFVASWNEYEEMLWGLGLTLDKIYWYRCKALEYSSDAQMKAEFPTTDVEAFANTGRGVFASRDIEALRKGCREPEKMFLPPAPGRKICTSVPLCRWRSPVPGREYIVAVDVGGRSSTADWSVISVLRLPVDGLKAEVVAQWRGHTDYDFLADTAIAVAEMYNEALLVVESNSLETKCTDDGNLYILNRMGELYWNVYRRRTYDSVLRAETYRIGFHTNRATKGMLVNTLIARVRDGQYVERDNEACNELATYEQLPNGAFAAKPGFHDDILMTRAMALLVAGEIAGEEDEADMAEARAFFGR